MKQPETNRILILEEDFNMAMEKALPALHSFAQRLCGDQAMADDLVQAACQRGLEKKKQLRELRGIKSWLYRLVYTRWQDLLRDRQRRRTKLYDLSNYMSQTNPNGKDQHEQAAISRLDLQQALATLSPEHRAALLLVSMQGYSYQEVAQILALPVGTVASRVARARIMLINCLRRERIK